MITTEDLPINTNTTHHGANINFKAFMTVKVYFLYYLFLVIKEIETSLYWERSS